MASLIDLLNPETIRQGAIERINESILEAGTKEEIRKRTRTISNKYHLPGEFTDEVTSYARDYAGNLNSLKEDIISRLSPYLNEYVK